jgi:hypothetical protein
VIRRALIGLAALALATAACKGKKAPPATAKPVPTGTPVAEDVARPARAAVRAWLDACYARDDARAAALVVLEGGGDEALARAAACEDHRAEAAMARVGDAVVAKFGPDSFQFSTAVWTRDFTGAVDGAQVLSDGARTTVVPDWGAVPVRQEQGAWKVVITPSQAVRAAPEETLQRAERVVRATEQVVANVSSGQLASPQAAGRALTHELMAGRTTGTHH